jgi:hypothetical protein
MTDYKVGDRVRLIDHGWNVDYGTLGSVVEITPSYTRVMWDSSDNDSNGLLMEDHEIEAAVFRPAWHRTRALQL